MPLKSSPRLFFILVLGSFSFLVMGLSGCHHAAHGTHQEHTREQAHSTAVTNGNLSLNQGQKWNMDEHTRESVQRIDQFIAKHQTPTSIEDYRGFAGQLNGEFDVLIEGCKMSGPAHDQLHLFLEKTLPKIANLKDTADPQTAETTYRGIIQLLSDYKNYFI
ncbi:MAG: hypothetical protein OEY59_09205 [Deltaproteobacteria bacterium]|nr:hypothetical protein [Deltaproteobacteria bacterium]